MRPSMLIMLLLLLATPAFASDGVLEINQTCAVQTGCFAGDTAGFPVQIQTEAGALGAAGGANSFRLTGDLVVNSSNTTSILVTADGITLDLNGFGIRCETSPDGDPPLEPCTPGVGHGIDASTADDITVKNGSIRFMGSEGVTAADRASISDVRVRQNGGDGVHVGEDSIVRNSTITGNAGTGVVVADRSIVEGNSASRNGGDGIFAVRLSVIRNNSASMNLGNGITAASSLIEGNSASNNGLVGISMIGPGGIARANVVAGNSGTEIETSGSCLVDSNMIWDGPLSPLLVLGGASSYRGNMLEGGGMTPVTAGINAGGNVCGNIGALCP